MYMHLFNMSQLQLPELPCLCGSFRRTARALTQLYEEALRPLQLTATQLTILQVLWRAGEVSQRQLGEILAMDSTTLTRTLRIMGRHAWVAERKGQDRRERRLRLAEGGRTQLQRATPLWERLQSRLRRRIGAEEWKRLLLVTNQIAKIAGSKAEQS
jgi:DNA-binding MarR family transcriptional regulator